MSAIFDALQAAEEGEVIATVPLRGPNSSKRILLTPLSFGVGLSVVLFLCVDFYLAEISSRRSIFNSLIPVNDYVRSIVQVSEMRERQQAIAVGDEEKLVQGHQVKSSSDVVALSAAPEIIKKIQDTIPNSAIKPDLIKVPKVRKPLAREMFGESSNQAFETLKTVQALVAELKQKIKHYSNDNVGIQSVVEQKLIELEARLSPGNLIVMRMKAYWLQKQGRSAAALSTYEGILMSHPDDMQASLNMVLLEMTLGQKQVAMQRLSDLEFVYPDSSELLKFRNQVVAHHGI